MVQIDDATVPLKDCFWVLSDPVGCAFASTIGPSAVEEEAAHRELITRQRDRDRQTRQGWTVQLLSREQWRQKAQPCFLGRCDHRKATA
ncbi:hypothetical protein ACGFZA_07475 [Streptomyces sp. NPDC048211]|uniref:hypothetical protein n=1 Tax=Streptomyces sp. NPDC048211 TaxID=3365516 RepID=UPI0037103EA7